jgi:anthranilate phosphoribosyltransferase
MRQFHEILRKYRMAYLKYSRGARANHEGVQTGSQKCTRRDASYDRQKRRAIFGAGTADGMKDLLARVVGGASLDESQSARAFDAIMTGQVPQADIAAFLTAQAARKPTVAEIVGAARAMRAHMKTVAAPEGAIDLCGTGGDGHDTLNISTAVSFVVAGLGVPVAKHGNRSATSRSGAADVLEALGLRIDLEPREAEACLREAGLCFLFAQAYHPAMRHVAQVRREIKTRTIFNLLGPISNPAGVKRQLVGVYADEWVKPLAEVLAALGSETAWVVHGADGLDELTTTAETQVVTLDGERTVTPEDAGLARATLASLKGGDARHNADAILRLLDGESGPFRDIVLLNAAAALIVAGRTSDLKSGAVLAAQSIDNGLARRTLDRLRALS